MHISISTNINIRIEYLHKYLHIFLKRQVRWSAIPIYMQVRKQQLEMDMEQQTGSK